MCIRDRFSPAAFHPVHAGQRPDGAGGDETGLCRVDFPGLSLLFLWRRLSAKALMMTDRPMMNVTRTDWRFELLARDGAARTGVIHTPVSYTHLTLPTSDLV